MDRWWRKATRKLRRRGQELIRAADRYLGSDSILETLNF
jgi:hypothetical protein